MAREIIDTTTDHGTYKGDPAKVAFEKANSNFAELYESVVGLAAVGGENMLLNCGVPINQRGFAGGTLAAGAYGYDRWKAGTGGCNVTINATTGVFTHTSGPLQQIVEAPQMAWGQPLTISVENPSGSITVSVGGATGTITSGSGRRGVTITPSGSGNMTVQLTATGATYARPKLERGATATPYVARHQGIEVAMCQRYYEKSYDTAVPPATSTNTGRCAFGNSNLMNGQNFMGQRFSVSKRASPAVTVYPNNTVDGSPTTPGFLNQDNNAPVPVTVTNIGIAGFEMIWNNQPSRWGGWFHWVADAEL